MCIHLFSHAKGYSGPEKFLGSPCHPTRGQPSGSVANGGSVYWPSQRSGASQRRSHRP